MPLISVEVRRCARAGRHLPTWYAVAPLFLPLGARVGYTRGQAEFRMRLAVVLHVLLLERLPKLPRRKVRP